MYRNCQLVMRQLPLQCNDIAMKIMGLHGFYRCNTRYRGAEVSDVVRKSAGCPAFQMAVNSLMVNS